MKTRVFFSIMTIVLVVMAPSCSTTVKVRASAGTQYENNQGQNAQVGSDGHFARKYKINQSYEAFEWTASNSGLWVPYALDYKTRSGFLEASSITLIVTTIPALVVTVIGALVDEPGLLMAGGAGAIVGLLGGGLPQTGLLQTDPYQYRFKYCRNQRDNTDLTFTKPQITYLDPPSSAKVKSEEDQNKADNTSSEFSVSTKKIGERSTKKILNHAALVEGTYIGKGSLKQNGIVIEKYEDIRVVVTRLENNVVSINVIESNGDAFFATGSKYDVVCGKDGVYQLTHTIVKDAKITVNSANSSYLLMNYNHPKINIEGDIYQLQIEANKML